MVSLCKDILLHRPMSADAFAAASPLQICALAAATNFAFHAKVTLVLVAATRLCKPIRDRIEGRSSLAYIAQYYRRPKAMLFQLAVNLGSQFVITYAVAKAARAAGWQSALPSWAHSVACSFAFSAFIPRCVRQVAGLRLTPAAEAAALGSLVSASDVWSVQLGFSVSNNVGMLVKRCVSRLRGEHDHLLLQDFLEAGMNVVGGCAASGAAVFFLSKSGVLQLGQPQEALAWWQLSATGALFVGEMAYGLGAVALGDVCPALECDPSPETEPVNLLPLCARYFEPHGEVTTGDVTAVGDLLVERMKTEVKTNSAVLYALQSASALMIWHATHDGSDKDEENNNGDDGDNGDERRCWSDAVVADVTEAILRDAHDSSMATQLPAHLELCDMATLKRYVRMRRLLLANAAILDTFPPDSTVLFNEPVDFLITTAAWFGASIHMVIE